MVEALRLGQIHLLTTALTIGLGVFATATLRREIPPSRTTAAGLICTATLGTLIYVLPWGVGPTPLAAAMLFGMGILGAVIEVTTSHVYSRPPDVAPRSHGFYFTLWGLAAISVLLIGQANRPAWNNAGAVILLVALGAMVGSNVQIFLRPMRRAQLAVGSGAGASRIVGSTASTETAAAPQVTVGPRFCQRCGAQSSGGDAFCANCGAALRAAATIQLCRQCGTPFVPGQRFCRKCGEQL